MTLKWQSCSNIAFCLHRTSSNLIFFFFSILTFCFCCTGISSLQTYYFAILKVIRPLGDKMQHSVSLFHFPSRSLLSISVSYFTHILLPLRHSTHTTSAFIPARSPSSIFPPQKKSTECSSDPV